MEVILNLGWKQTGNQFFTASTGKYDNFFARSIIKYYYWHVGYNSMKRILGILEFSGFGFPKKNEVYKLRLSSLKIVEKAKQ